MASILFVCFFVTDCWRVSQAGRDISVPPTSASQILRLLCPAQINGLSRKDLQASSNSSL